MGKQNCLIYCNCGAGIISDEKQQQLATAFKSLNIDVFELHDICANSLNEKDFLNSFEKDYEFKYVVACYPRAIDNIFRQNNINIGEYQVLNFRELTTEKIVETLKKEITATSTEVSYQIKKSNLKVPAWYPVIDESRCTLCGQYARFCVFGVYKYTKKSLEVINPLSCKNNCPACGRTCPASAIIFPRLPENSVLSGEEPGNEFKPVKPAQKEGLFVLLNERNSVRRNIFKQGVMQQAEEEKRRAIEELKKGLKKK